MSEKAEVVVTMGLGKMLEDDLSAPGSGLCKQIKLHSLQARNTGHLLQEILLLFGSLSSPS